MFEPLYDHILWERVFSPYFLISLNFYFYFIFTLNISDSSRMVVSYQRKYEDTKNWLATEKSVQEQCNINDLADMAKHFLKVTLNPNTCTI